MSNELPRPLDNLDRQLIGELRSNPRSSLTSLAKRTGVARGTVYSRLDQLESTGVITGYGPEIDAASAGFSVLAFCTLEIEQGSHDATTSELAKLTEILEIHTVTGEGDLLVRIVATSNDHLHELIQTMSTIPTIARTQTQLALATTVSRPVTHVLDPES